LSQRPHRRRTWAPRGQTPVLQFHFNWKTLSVIAGVTVWNFYFQIFEEAIKSEQIIEFLKHLLRYIEGDILLIWDRLPAHRSKITQQFIRDQKGRLEIEYLPPYAPELNPVEYIWAHCKQHELPNVCAKNLWGPEPRSTPLPQAHAPPTATDHRLLEAGFFIRLIPLYYAGFSNKENKRAKSDTPREAGGLMGWAASKAVGLQI
jgi:transposase